MLTCCGNKVNKAGEAPLFLARSRGKECGRQNERERKKEFSIALMMNSSSTVWASYCSSA